MNDSEKLVLGLDEIIRMDRTSNRRGGRGGKRGFQGRGGGGGVVAGSSRGGGQNNGFRNRGGGGLPRTLNTPTGRWKHDLYDDNTIRGSAGQRNSGVSSTTKLLIHNLFYGVTTNDIQELFEDVGAVRAAHVHFDENGQSLGTAEVVYERRVDAIAAVKKYNGVNLDGRPMDIKLVGGNDNAVQQQTYRGSNMNTTNGRNQRSGIRSNNQQNGTRGGNLNRLRGGKQQNGTTVNKKATVTTEDLDADLDAYRAESSVKK